MPGAGAVLPLLLLLVGPVLLAPGGGGGGGRRRYYYRSWWRGTFFVFFFFSAGGGPGLAGGVDGAVVVAAAPGWCLSGGVGAGAPIPQLRFWCCFVVVLFCSCSPGLRHHRHGSEYLLRPLGVAK